MSFLYNVSPEILQILYKGEHFQPLTKYSLKSDDIGYFQTFSKACDVATVLAFHHALIDFVKKPEVETINIFYCKYPVPVWADLIGYTLKDEENTSRKIKAQIKKEWDTVCRRGFPYKKTGEFYGKVFGSMLHLPDSLNMSGEKLRELKKNPYHSYTKRDIFYFKISENNIDDYLKFLLGEEHYKYYYISTENFLINKVLEESPVVEKTSLAKRGRL